MFKVVCGGSLIDERHVLTAAHCFPGGRNSGITHVRLGEHNVDSSRDGASPEDVAIARVTNHRSYDSDSLRNDISVLRLTRSVRFSREIAPVCLPDAYVGNDLTRVGDPTVIGWGSTRTGGSTSSALRQVCLCPTMKQRGPKRRSFLLPASIPYLSKYRFLPGKPTGISRNS